MACGTYAGKDTPEPNDKIPPLSTMNQRYQTIFLLVAMIIFALMGISVAQEIVSAQPAYRETVLTGFTRARAVLPLVAETSGKVLSVSADIGSAIDRHGVFARLDPTLIELDLEANRVAQEQQPPGTQIAQGAGKGAGGAPGAHPHTGTNRMAGDPAPY